MNLTTGRIETQNVMTIQRLMYEFWKTNFDQYS